MLLRWLSVVGEIPLVLAWRSEELLPDKGAFMAEEYFESRPVPATELESLLNLPLGKAVMPDGGSPSAFIRNRGPEL